MILGHAAGVAAALAAKANTPVQDIHVPELQKILLAEGGVFELGVQHQLKGLSAIRNKFQPVTRTRPVPWDRPAKRGSTQ